MTKIIKSLTRASYSRGGRAGYFFGGRAGYAEGGPIYSRLGTLSSGVQSAEQQLQGINASLQKAESDLGSDSPGGGSSLAGGPSFTSNFEEANNQGPGSNLLFGGSGDGTINNTAVPKTGGMYKDSDFSNGAIPPMFSNSQNDGTNTPGSPNYGGGGDTPAPISSIGGNSSPPSTGGQDPARQAYDKLQADVKEQRARSPYSRNVLYGENLTFENFKTSYDAGTDPQQPTYSGPEVPQGQLQPSTLGGGLGGLLGNNSGNKIMDTRDRSNDNRSYEERVRLAQEANDAPTGIMRNDGTRANLTYKNFMGLDPQITNLNQLPTGQPQPISEERMNSLNRSAIGNGFYDLNKGLGGLL